MATTTYAVTLTEKESRALHALDRSIEHWREKVSDRNYTGRDEIERDLCVEALSQFSEIRDILLARD